MLIIEGPDNIGKTTLCHKLVRFLGEVGPWQYRHSKKPPETWDYPESYFEHMSRFMVMDRFHMSEIVYSHARGDKHQLQPWAYKLIDAMLRQFGGFTVVLSSTDESLATNYEAREQNYDARINSIANLTFKEIGECGKHHNIHCDVDYHYQCQTGVWPAEDPNLIDSILKGYLWRWLNVYKTLAGETDVLRKIRKRAVEIIKL